MLSLVRDVASHEGNFGGLKKKALLEELFFQPSSLLSHCALDSPVQGLVELSPDTFVFTLRNAALLTLDFELEQLILELVELEIGTAGTFGWGGWAPAGPRHQSGRRSWSGNAA